VILGYAYGSQYSARQAYQNSAEVSVYIASLGQRRGQGQAFYKALIEHLTDLGVHTLIGIVTTPNSASARLHKACGFELVGTHPRCSQKIW
jgi:L-amino acid N-acyltransferase YncA